MTTKTSRGSPRGGRRARAGSSTRPTRPSAPPSPLHQDPGLQPERTVMSWDRTLLALFVTSMMFLRWYSTEGLLTLVPAALCGTAALAIHLTQRKRYTVQATGITQKRVAADIWATLWLVALVITLAALGIAAIWWL